MKPPIQLVVPRREALSQYVEALRNGWSPDNSRPVDAPREQLAAIDADAEAFLARQIDPEAKGPPFTMPDGTQVPRLPGITLWIWDGEFCGTINFRWQDGTDALPGHVLGHIGYSVVPWKRGRGYATAALGLMLERARARGMRSVEITCDEGNAASRRVIEANGGVLVERFVKIPMHGGAPALRFRIDLGAR